MPCAATSLEKNLTRYQVPEIINHPYDNHQLTSITSTSRILLLLVVGVTAVVVALADCCSGGDGHLHVAAVLDVVGQFNLVRNWFKVKRSCAHAHRLTSYPMSQKANAQL